MRTVAVLAILAAASLFPLPAQSGGETEVLPGSILVAGRELRDPNFAQTVIFIASYEPEGIVGIVLNRPTKVPVARALDGETGAKTRTDPVFAGGPVTKSAVFGILRSPSKVDGADRVFADVHLTIERRALQKLLSAGTSPNSSRIYLGYAGWDRGQLEAEIAAGAWHVFPPSAALVFDSDPETLWARLIKITETRIAYCFRRPRNPFNRSPAAF